MLVTRLRLCVSWKLHVWALLSCANANGWCLRQIDIKTAFLEAELPKGAPMLYMTAPEGHGRPGFICKLKRALYSLKELPHLWNKELHGWLAGHGFSQSKSDPCLYVNCDRTMYLCIYDDALLAFVSEMQKRFVVTDCGMPEVFLGVQLAYDRVPVASCACVRLISSIL